MISPRFFILVWVLAKVGAAGLFFLPPFVAGTLFFAPDLWLLIQSLCPNTQGLGPVARGFTTDKHEVWLTIDDGPDPATTTRVLDLLDAHDAHATFFVIGARVRQFPELAREMVRRGHTLGNHTNSHPLLTFWIPRHRRTAREVDACAAALEEAGVPATAWFRAPAGIKNFFLHPILAQRQLCHVGWTTRGREGTSLRAAAPLARLIRGIRPGAILLTHESGPSAEVRFEVLSRALEYLKTNGYSCVLPPRESLR